MATLSAPEIVVLVEEPEWHDAAPKKRQHSKSGVVFMVVHFTRINSIFKISAKFDFIKVFCNTMFYTFGPEKITCPVLCSDLKNGLTPR